MLRIIAELVWRAKKRAEYTETFWCPYFRGLSEVYRAARK